jgi:magnesium transporter
MQAHKHVIEKLAENHSLPLAAVKFRLYFKGLIEHAKEIWDSLANYQDTVNALHDAHASLINTKSNQAVKVLSAIAVITFPLTLIAAIFAMRTEGMPFVHHPHSFWYIVTGMALLATTMMVIFKRRKWL